MKKKYINLLRKKMSRWVRLFNEKIPFFKSLNDFYNKKKAKLFQKEFYWKIALNIE